MNMLLKSFSIEVYTMLELTASTVILSPSKIQLCANSHIWSARKWNLQSTFIIAHSETWNQLNVRKYTISIALVTIL